MNLQLAAIAWLGERQTEDLKVPDSIPGLGMRRASCILRIIPEISTERRDALRNNNIVAGSRWLQLAATAELGERQYLKCARPMYITNAHI